MNQSAYILIVSKIRDGRVDVFGEKVNFDDPSNENISLNQNYKIKPLQLYSIKFRKLTGSIVQL